MSILICSLLENVVKVKIDGDQQQLVADAGLATLSLGLDKPRCENDLYRNCPRDTTAFTDDLAWLHTKSISGSRKHIILTARKGKERRK